MFRSILAIDQSPFSLRYQLVGFAGWFLVTFIAAAFGALASLTAGNFYMQLVRPDWAPPAWLFGPVWTVLYVMMAISVWLVWRLGTLARARIALGLFVVQLVANSLWTWLFFAWHQGALAFAEILVLWMLLAGTISMFWTLHRVAAILLMPYLVWVTFASMLCLVVWLLNPATLS
jgi:tryptophan-rich sensory protein